MRLPVLFAKISNGEQVGIYKSDCKLKITANNDFKLYTDLDLLRGLHLTETGDANLPSIIG